MRYDLKKALFCISKEVWVQVSSHEPSCCCGAAQCSPSWQQKPWGFPVGWRIPGCVNPPGHTAAPSCQAPPSPPEPHLLPDHIQREEQERQVHHRGRIRQHHLQGGGDQRGRVRLREAGQGEEGRVWADSPHHRQDKQPVPGAPLQVHHQGVRHQRQRPRVRAQGVQWLGPRNVTSGWVLQHSPPLMAGLQKHYLH